MKTLENLLRMTVPAKDKDGNDIDVTPEFRIAVQHIKEDGVYIIVHPFGHSGDTLDFLVNDNNLQPMSDNYLYKMEKRRCKTCGKEYEAKIPPGPPDPPPFYCDECR